MTRNKQLQFILDTFYQNPLVAVSLELMLSILAISFFAFFAIRPTMLTMIDLIQEINDKKDYSKQLEKKVISLSTAQTNYQKLANKIVLLDQAIPHQPELLLTLKIIEKLVSEQQLAIESLQVAEFNLANLTTAPSTMKNLTDQSGTELLPAGSVSLPVSVSSTQYSLNNKAGSSMASPVNLKLRLTVNGDFPSIVNLVRNLQNSRRLIVIEQINFTVQESRNKQQLTANLDLITPYFSTTANVNNNADLNKVERVEKAK